MRSLLSLLPLSFGVVWQVGAVQVDASTFSKTKFDFLVVGGGTAGTAVAARLSEVASFKVGIIEAGNYHKDDPKILIPNAYFPMWGDPEYDWLSKTTPQKNMAGRVLDLPRGKGLGGSSQINDLGFLRAGAVEYDLWEQLGNPGWGWNSTLRYMIKSENNSAPDAEIRKMTFASADPSIRGHSGPIHTSFASWYTAAVLPFYYVLQRFGLKTKKDVSDGTGAGWVGNSMLVIDQATQTRSYAANGYYEPNAQRPNLILVTGAQVTRVILSDKADRNGNFLATGVEFVDTASSTKYTVNATREVIVSGGGVQTPQILELSGIGDKNLLKKFGIPVKIDNPNVGEGYQDHPLNPQTFEVPRSIITFDVFNDPANNATEFGTFQADLSGAYAGGIDAMAFLRAKDFLDDSSVQQWLRTSDAEFNKTKPTRAARILYEANRRRVQRNSNEALLEIFILPLNLYPDTAKVGHSYFEIAGALQHPFSRGSVHIGSKDPLVLPDIDLNGFGLSIDRNIVAAAAQYIRGIAQSTEYKPFIVDFVRPGLNTSTIAEWRDYVEQTTLTVMHPCCTAAMLPRDTNGVVSPRLVVYGTSNLRVVDASIMPFITGQHPLSTVYAIAEHAADLIKQDNHAPTH